MVTYCIFEGLVALLAGALYHLGRRALRLLWSRLAWDRKDV